MDLIAAFRLFVRTLAIHFALLGRKRKYIKSKTTAKLKEKRTSIAAVRDILRMFDTFPNPLLSRCRLPLNIFSALTAAVYNCAVAKGAKVLVPSRTIEIQRETTIFLFIPTAQKNTLAPVRYLLSNFQQCDVAYHVAYRE